MNTSLETIDAPGVEIRIVDPAGDVNSKPGFLDLVESGTLDYLDWTIESPQQTRTFAVDRTVAARAGMTRP